MFHLENAGNLSIRLSGEEKRNFCEQFAKKDFG
jgi:hypothetical protein